MLRSGLPLTRSFFHVAQWIWFNASESSIKSSHDCPGQEEVFFRELTAHPFKATWLPYSSKVELLVIGGGFVCFNLPLGQMVVPSELENGRCSQNHREYHGGAIELLNHDVQGQRDKSDLPHDAEAILNISRTKSLLRLKPGSSASTLFNTGPQKPHGRTRR